jgi:DNA ligase-1
VSNGTLFFVDFLILLRYDCIDMNNSLEKFLTKPFKPSFPELYSKNVDNSIQLWRVEVDGNRYRYVSGRLDGKLVTSEWTICEGKNVGKSNETTSEEQARKEAKAAFQKKLKSGGYWENINDVGNVKFIAPMLAYKYNTDDTKIDFSNGEWLVQVKYNGTRCIATKNGLFTRKGERYISVPHIESELSNFFSIYPNSVLDGELYNYNLRQQLNELVKICLKRKKTSLTPELLDKSEKIVRFYIYDGYKIDDIEYGEDSPYHCRKHWIDTCVIPSNIKYCKEVQSFQVFSENEMFNMYNYFINDGDEGAMLRRRYGKYEHKRTKNLLKVKPTDDAEGVILEIKEGTGNWSKTGKVITLRWNGKIFDSTFKGTYEQAVQFLKDKQMWIGKTITFQYTGLSGLGNPQAARIDINNCLK